jgi:hypothetical protein
MNGENVSYASGETREQVAASSKAAVVMGTCCLTIILALVLGVGLASNLVVRHLVQTAPLWAGVVLGFRRACATSWVGLPLFLFWLLLMGLIWSYLLGISHLLSGQFSSIEIAMTVIVGVASLGGLVSFARAKSFLSPLGAAGLFALMGALQVVCFRLSFLPAIAHR